MSILNMLSEALQAAGAGLTLSSTLETSYGEYAGPADYVCIVLGVGLWGGGLYLARREKLRKQEQDVHYDMLDEDEKPVPSLSTRAITKALTYGAGFAMISSITKWAKEIDATSKNTEFLFSGVMDLLALVELRRASKVSNAPVIPHERLRFVATFVTDLFLVGALKHLMDSDIDVSDIAVVLLGSAGFMLEGAYGLKKDENISLTSTLLRRAMKMALPTGIVFLADDLLESNHSKYAMSDDAFLVLNGVLLASVLYMIRKIVNDIQAQQYIQEVSHYEPPIIDDNVIVKAQGSQHGLRTNVFDTQSSFDIGRRAPNLVIEDLDPIIPAPKSTGLSPTF